MDFDELLACAGSNVKKHRKKVKEADREIERERQIKLEKLASQKKMEREEARRKAPPKPVPPKPPKFVIPKKTEKAKPEVDKEKLAKFLNRQEEEKRQKELEKKREKDELIRLRLEAMGGKIRYGHNSEHADELLKRQQREEEAQDKLSSIYRQGVYKALEHKNKVVSKLMPSSSARDAKIMPNSSSKSKSSNDQFQSSSRPTTAPHKRPPAPISHSKGNSAAPSNGSNKSGVSERKRKMPETDFRLLMKKAEQNSKYVDDDGFTVPNASDIPSGPSPPKQSRKDKDDLLATASRVQLNGISHGKKQRDELHTSRERSSKFGTHAKRSEVTKELLDFAAKSRLPSKSLGHSSGQSSSVVSAKQQMLRQNFDNKASRSEPSSISTKNLGRDKHAVATASKILAVDPELGPIREKRYLPGDIRYKGGPAALAPANLLKRPALTASEPSSSSSKLRQQQENGFDRALAASKFNSSSINRVKQGKESLRPDVITNAKPAKPKAERSEAEIRAEIERRRRETRLMEKELEQRRIQAGRRKMDISLSKIKREEQMRYELKKQMAGHSRDHEKKKKNGVSASRFTNFSETDEDEEDDEEELFDEEEDSEMDDFIDDTMVEDLQREDFDETLRLINPRYDKKKWKMREMMIPEAGMEARYKDIESEEFLSAKIGIYEDMREARRGSKQVA